MPLPRYLHAAGPAAKGAAALSFVLSVQFPPVDARRFWLLISARDAQGLPGPVFARLPIPISAFSRTQEQQQQQPVAPRHQGSGGVKAAAESLGKRKRGADDAPLEDAAAAAAAGGSGTTPEPAAAAAAAMAPPAPVPGWQQDSALSLELSAAVAWARQRITHERLLFELRTLGVACQELQPPGGDANRDSTVAAAAAASKACAACAAPPSGALQLKLVGAIGVEQLGAQLVRKGGAATTAAAAVGIREAVLCACSSGSGEWSMHVRGLLYKGFACSAPKDQNGPSSSGGHSSGGWTRFDYSFERGQHARDALLHLLRVVRMQRLLCRLEALALGPQWLEVDTSSTISSSSSSGGGAGADSGLDRLQDEGDEDQGEATAAGGRPTKKARVGAASDTAAATAGAAAANGDSHRTVTANGTGSAAAAAAGAACNRVASSSRSSGLIWHWSGSGTVRLIGCSSTTAVLECGKPLPTPPSVVGGAAAAGGAGAAAAEQSQQLDADSSAGRHDHHQQQQLLRLAFSWAPTDGDCATSGAAAADSPQSALQLRCRVRSGVPALDAALQVLGEMADADEPGLLLDALGICGWPLAALAAALKPAALQRVGLRAGDVSAHGRGSPYSMRLLVSAADGCGAGGGGGGDTTAPSTAGEAAATPAAAAAAHPAAALHLAFASGGRIRLALAPGKPPQQQKPSGAAGNQSTATASSSVLRAAEAETELLDRLREAVPAGVKLVGDAGGAVWVHASGLGGVVPAALAVARTKAAAAAAGVAW